MASTNYIVLESLLEKEKTKSNNYFLIKPYYALDTCHGVYSDF